MYKTLSNICITIALGLLIFTLVKPTLANEVTDKVLGLLVQGHPSQQISESSGGRIQPLVPVSFIDYLHTIRAGSVQPVQSIVITSTGGTTALATEDIVNATNQERIKAGLPPLRLNAMLVASAKLKTNDMITNQYFEHISPSGKGVADLGQEVGYSYVIMGENLALGDFATAQDVVTAWMNSPGHRANILNPNYQDIGAYAAKGMYEGKEVWFAVQHFGTAREVCPSISTTLKTQIDTINADLKQRQAHIADEKAILEAPDHPEGDAYKTMVADFNALVAEYNTELVISQEKTKEYNAQVSAFNNCLTEYQVKNKAL